MRTGTTMDKAKRWLEEKAFWLKTGTRLEIANDGKAVEPVVIRFRDYYIEILLDAETGDPCDWGWSTSPTMSHVPIRDYYIARLEKGEDDE